MPQNAKGRVKEQSDAIMQSFKEAVSSFHTICNSNVGDSKIIGKRDPEYWER